MPGFIKSKAQLRKLFALGARGELEGGTAKAESMAHEEGHKRLSKLPEYVHKAEGGAIVRECPHCGGKYADGGEVEDEQDSWGDPEDVIDEPENRPPLVTALRRRSFLGY